jgi:hypothetical protein
LTVAGCASTRVTNAWRDPGYAGPAFTRLLVLGVGHEGGIRRTFEEEFSRKLAAAGVHAVPGYQLIARDGKVPDDELRSAVVKAGVDGVLITRLVRVDVRTRYVPGHVMVMPAYGYHDSFYGYYGASWAYVWPPTVEQYEVVTLETNLWDARSERLVWSAMTESFAPTDIRRATGEFAGVVIGALREQSLI